MVSIWMIIKTRHLMPLLTTRWCTLIMFSDVNVFSVCISGLWMTSVLKYCWCLFTMVALLITFE